MVLLSPNPAGADIEKCLQEKGLQYLGGYVLQKLHNKHRSRKILQLRAIDSVNFHCNFLGTSE